MEYPSGKGTYQESDEYGKSQGYPYAVGYIASEMMVVSGTEALGHGYRKACAYACTEAYDHKADGTGGTYAGQGIDPHKLADDDRIYHAVELLKNISDKHGQGKMHYMPRDTSGSHIYHAA